MHPEPVEYEPGPAPDALEAPEGCAGPDPVVHHPLAVLVAAREEDGRAGDVRGEENLVRPLANVRQPEEAADEAADLRRKLNKYSWSASTRQTEHWIVAYDGGSPPLEILPLRGDKQN